MPDVRGWIVLGLFVLSGYIFTLIAINPKLAEVQLFDVLATAVVGGGGVVAAIGWYFSSSKSSSEKDAVIAQQLDKGKAP